MMREEIVILKIFCLFTGNFSVIIHMWNNVSSCVLGTNIVVLEEIEGDRSAAMYHWLNPVTGKLT